MSTTVSGMHPVTLPRFAPSHTGVPQSSDALNFVSDSGDGLDFDLLAEYLLDDSLPSMDNIQLPNFDFNLESTSNSGVVSPEQSEDGMPSLKEGSIVQVQNIIAAHAASQVKKNVETIAPAPPSAPGQPTGVPMGPVPGLFPTAAAPAVVAPAPAVVVHQHGTNKTVAPNKRRRVDAPPMVMPAPQFPAAPTTGRVRQKSQAQIERRRERNRILARRTRLRKKFFFESLQKEVIDLQRENVALKDIAKTRLEPSQAKILLDECKAAEQLPDSIVEACGEAKEMDAQDFNLVKSIQCSQKCFVITDPSLQDNPIVYASDDFLTLTGYAREDVLGRNCRFLQGTETSQAKVEKIRKAVSNGEDVTVTMINYTADGTAFWNKLFIAALRDAQNNIVNYIGVIVKVAAPDANDPEAGKRLPGEQTPADEDNEDSDGQYGESQGMNQAIEDAFNQATEGVE